MPLAAAVAAARKYADRRDLPPLTGSPAQVEWAETIRYRLLRNMEQTIRHTRSVARSNALLDKKLWMIEQTAAVWWIDNSGPRSRSEQRQRFAQALAGYTALLGS